MNNHRHQWLYRNEVIGGAYKLHRLFRNPKTKRVLVGCITCHPKKKIVPKKNGQIFFE